MVVRYKKLGPALLACAVLNVTACAHQEIGNSALPGNEPQIAVHADDIQWKPCPPALPEGCELVVLEGDPRRLDLFTVRFRLSDAFVMRPHTHPRHERVTILDGQVRVAFGMDARRETAKVFYPGDYYVNSRDAIHSVWIDKPTILQITGVGPWEANFVTTP